MILVVSDCEDGDLVLDEPGIRLKLSSGDIVAFPSSDISHFNMHFTGERVSIVFHSDIAGDKWVENRNLWDQSLFMISSDNGGGDL